MAKPHQRVFSLVMAVMFLVTTIAFSLAVVWQIRNEDKGPETTDASIQEQSDEITQEGKLQGTKLEGFTPIAKIDSLQKIDTQVGTGEEVKAGASVVAHYTGATASDGVIFQSSLDGGQPIPFSLDGVIAGWTEGVPGMKVGGKRRLLIPAAQAYGENPPPNSGIPPNADLVFDIEIVSLGQ